MKKIWKKEINLKITDWNKNTLKNVEYCNLKDHAFSFIHSKNKIQKVFHELNTWILDLTVSRYIWDKELVMSQRKAQVKHIKIIFAIVQIEVTKSNIISCIYYDCILCNVLCYKIILTKME